MKKFAFVVSACCKYIPELTALLNSLEFIGNKHDVYLIGYKLPADFEAQFSALSYKVIHYAVPEEEAREYGGESEILCRKRYWYAAEWGKNYDAVCLLDADMLAVRNMDVFFEVASHDFILGVTLEQKTVYGAHDHQRVSGHHWIKEHTWNEKDMCCTPMFINAKRYEDELKDSWNIFTQDFPENNFKAPDQQALNMILLAHGLNNKKILLPNMCWVASNEKLLKPYTRFTVQQDGKIWTESGEPVFIIHGQFYKKAWRDNQLVSRHGCAEGYLGFSFNSDQMARGAMDGLYEFFKKNLHGAIRIDAEKAYTNNGFPEKTIPPEEIV